MEDVGTQRPYRANVPQKRSRIPFVLYAREQVKLRAVARRGDRLAHGPVDGEDAYLVGRVERFEQVREHLLCPAERGGVRVGDGFIPPLLPSFISGEAYGCRPLAYRGRVVFGSLKERVAASPAVHELGRRLPARVRAAARRLFGELPSPAPRGARSGTRLILMYHRVATAEADPLELCVAPERFREQLELLGSLGEIVPLETLVRDRRGHGLKVALTFDDGYADNALAAAPLLAAEDASATVFVVAGAVGSARPFWWDRLAALIYDGDGTAYWSAWERLRKLPADRIEQELESLEAVHGAAKVDVGSQPVSEDELLSLARGPVEIGGHTVSHPSLPALPEASRRVEIATGRKRLESLIGRPIATFAYPYGDYDVATVRLVRTGRLSPRLHDLREPPLPFLVAAPAAALRSPRLDCRRARAARDRLESAGLARRAEAISRPSGPPIACSAHFASSALTMCSVGRAAGRCPLGARCERDPREAVEGSDYGPAGQAGQCRHRSTRANTRGRQSTGRTSRRANTSRSTRRCLTDGVRDCGPSGFSTGMSPAAKATSATAATA